MTSTLRSVCSSLLLAAAFAGVAGPASANEPDTVRGPTGSKDYTALYLKIFDAAEMDKNVNDKLKSMVNVGTMDPDDVIALQRGSVQKVNEFGPYLLLTRSISERDVADLISQIPEDFTETPTYLKIAKGKAAYLHECQAKILNDKSEPSSALATEVAKCMEAEFKKNPAPAKKADAAAPVISASAAAPAPTAQKSGYKDLLTPMNIGIGGGGLALLTLGGIFALTRKKKEAPAASQTAIASAKPQKIDL